MDKQESEKFKTLLQAYRAKLASGISHIERDMLNKSQRDSSGDLSGYTFHMADQATDNFDTEFNLDIASNEQKFLNEIDEAIKRIDEGVFGICEECEKPIAVKRLKAVPYARYCIKCQEGIEKNNR
ncbi:MAG: TraR/DksA C4-type zinc finger protein [Candidatus Omnitrophica bacterium]|nr:TraR/DksA C4-type zinc finger protein [Candidatus Omnitrophota bacterium]